MSAAENKSRKMKEICHLFKKIIIFAVLKKRMIYKNGLIIS